MGPDTSLQSLDDFDLLRRVGAGNRDALNVLFDRHAGRVYDLAYRTTRDAGGAESALASAFQAMLDDLHAGEFPDAPGAWIYVKARSASLDERWKQRRLAPGEAPQEPDDPRLWSLPAPPPASEPQAPASEPQPPASEPRTSVSEPPTPAPAPEPPTALEAAPQETPLAAEPPPDSGRLPPAVAEPAAPQVSLPAAPSPSEPLAPQAHEPADLAAPVWRAAAALDPEDYTLLHGHIRMGLSAAEIDDVVDLREPAASRLSFLRIGLEAVGATAVSVFAALAAIPLPDDAASRTRDALLARSQPPVEEEPPPRSKSRAIVAIVAAVVVLGGGAAGAIIATRDGAAPPARDPSDVRSDTHSIGGASTANTIGVVWSRVRDASGFSVAWSQEAEEIPDQIVDLPGTATATTSPALAPGRWYFHLRTRGSGGDWTATVHLGPFFITSADTPVLSIASVRGVEADGVAVPFGFEVTLTPPPGVTVQRAVTVAFATVDATATAPADYAAARGTLTFQPGETTKTVTISVAGDDESESDETFKVRLSGPKGASLGEPDGTGTIVDDDSGARFVISGDTVAEGGSATFTVTLLGRPTKPASVSYATANGSASSASDYTGTRGGLDFPLGTTTRTVTVRTRDDDFSEADETFSVRLSGVSGATIAIGSATGRILDDDGEPRLSISDVRVAETAGRASFRVTLLGKSALTVTASYRTANGSAAAPGDFGGVSGTLTFTTGQTSKTITVAIVNDSAPEPDESFTVAVSNPRNATIVDGSGTGTITDDDKPALSIADASGSETGGSVTFAVTLSAPTGKTVTVAYATSNGSAQAPGDYTAKSGTLTFSAGVTSRTISVAVVDDEAIEADETFTVTLSAAVNATISDGSATGTISSEDALPVLSIDNVSSGEVGTATFTVTMSRSSSSTVTVSFATANGSAAAPGDYTAKSGTLTFSPGDTSKTIGIAIVADGLDENDETYTVGLSNPSGATLGDATGTGTIADDDASPTVSIGDTITGEGGGSAQFTVTLSTASGRTVTVDFATANGSAVAGSDYVSKTGTVTFAPGETTKTISVTLIDDFAAEGNETFSVVLSNAANASISDGTGVCTINDNE